MQSDIDELSDGPTPFDKEAWIGKGRKYPEHARDVPLGLSYYLQGLLDIPDEIKAQHFPNAYLSVKDFIAQALPKISHSLPTINPKSCFCKEAANEIAVTHEIPALSWLKKLKEHFLQAALDNMKSVEDPCYPGSRLPFWMISFWMEMHTIHDVQQHWKEGMRWVEGYIQKGPSTGCLELLKQARALLVHIRWNEQLDIPGAGGGEDTATPHLGAYLSDKKMMAGDHINMMFSYLADRAEKDPATDSFVVIETLRFMNAVVKVASDKTGEKVSQSFLRRLEDRIKKGDVQALIFPVFMAAEAHWVAIRIDFEEEEISYGDSLIHKGMPPPTSAIKSIQAWLKRKFDKQYKNTGDSLAHGAQDNFTDCGLLAANTAAHDVFIDPLWTSNRKVREKVQWFVNLTESHIEDVNGSENRKPYNIVSSLQSATSEERALPSAQSIPKSMLHLLNPDQDHDSLSTSLPKSMSHLLNPSPAELDASITTPSEAEIERVPNIEPSAEKSIANTGPDEDIEMAQAETLSTMAILDVKELGMKEEVGSQSVKRCATDDLNMRPPKVGKSSPYEDLHRVVSVQCGLRPIVKSTLWSRIQNRRFIDGDFKPMPERDVKFKNKILAIDKNAVIINPKMVRHFRCGKELAMKEPYNTGNFKTHHEKCKGTPKSHKNPAGGMKSIDSFFAKGSNLGSTKTMGTQKTIFKPKKVFPCPGLSGTVYPDVENYLERTGAHGGGGKSVSAIAFEFFGKKYRKLSAARKRQVKTAQTHDWIWRNDHNLGVVHSTYCFKEAQQATTVSNGSALSPCVSCQSLLSKKVFKNAIKRRRPADNNYKYVNLEYRNEKLASLYGRCNGLREIMEDKSNSPLIRYCKGVASGRYKGNDLFGLLLQAIVIKRDKEARGVGMQNFKYAPDLVEFAHIIQTHSSRAYNALKDFLPLPNTRTLQLQRSHQPRFPTGIQDRTYSLVIERLNQLLYDGPVALSCDDTKLLASFRPYYDNDREGYYLMGHAGEPVQLADHEAFRDVVNEHKLQKATKLRLWCIQVPLPKIPTIIAAAVAIPDNLTASDLMVYLWEIISGFLSRKVKITSYAADGSNVERNAQRLLEERATSTVIVPIKHPHTGHGTADFIIKIPFFGPHPIATIQDPKHLLKTFRNNLFSGARLLTFPTDVATFSQVRKISVASDSPIYVRDVEKADRQDDNAATRLFSAATLEWLATNHPEHLGLLIYLFVCGELIDAYQNRFLTLTARVQMVLRAHYFIELWEKFLDVSKYPKARHYVSPQCADITRTVIHGYLQSVIIYRDYCGEIRPLIAWLLSTEVVEHVFGLCRQIVKDFTMLDFHYMVPKLFIALRQSVLSSKSNDGKARASGYNHTYTDTRGINIQALSTYPSNLEINEAAVRAYSEAESLFAVLGVTAADIYFESTSISHLPSIRTWFNEDLTDILFGEESDDESDISSNSEMEDYQQALDDLEEVNNDLPAVYERRLMDHRYASIALSIEERAKILSIAELDDDAMDEAISDDADQVSHIISQCGHATAVSLPPVKVDEPENPFNSTDPTNIDLSELIRLRFSHQTEQAASGVRTSKAAHPTTGSGTASKSLTNRQGILRGFSEIIRERGEKGIGTGLERMYRWTRNPAPGGREGEIDGVTASEPAAGNSANAAAAAETNAKKALTRRKNIFKKFGLPDILSEARINALTPLRAAGGVYASGFGIALSPTLNQLVICKVIDIYAKTGGKNAKNGAVTDSSNIMAVSYIAVQCFEHQIGTQFRDTPHGQPLRVLRFDHLPPSAFLCSLKHAPELTQNGLKISTDDMNLFKQLKDNLQKVLRAVKAFGKQKTFAEDDE